MPGKTEAAPADSNGKSTYVGSVQDMSMEAMLSLGPQNNCSTIPTVRLFLAKYRAYPCVAYTTGEDDTALLHATTITEHISNELKHDLTDDCVSRNYHRPAKQDYVASRLSDLGNGVMIEMPDTYFMSDVQNPNKLKPDHSDDYFLIVGTLTIYYLPQHDQYARELARTFSKMTVFSSKSCTLQMVCRNQNGYYLSGINIKKPLITDLALHYGKNFVPTHERVIKNLNKKEGKGIVLLHGVPGSGKQPLSTVPFRQMTVCLFHYFLSRQDALHSISDPRDHRQDVDLRSTGHGEGDLVARVLALSHAIPRLSSDHRRRREHHQGSKRDADPVSGRRQSSQLVSFHTILYLSL